MLVLLEEQLTGYEQAVNKDVNKLDTGAVRGTKAAKSSSRHTIEVSISQQAYMNDRPHQSHSCLPGFIQISSVLIKIERLGSKSELILTGKLAVKGQNDGSQVSC